MINRLILWLLPLALPAYVLRFQIGPLPTTLLEIIFLALFVAWAIQERKNWKSIYSKTKTWLLPLSLWLIAGIIGVCVADNHVAALGLWRAYFLEPVFAFVMLRSVIETDKDKAILLRSICLTLIGASLWAIFQAVTKMGIPAPWNLPPIGIRATGPFPFPNALALFCVPIAALCFHFAISDKPLIHRAWLIAAFLGGLISALVAKSDGGIIALAAAVFVSLVLKKKTRLVTIAIAVVGATIIFAVPSLRVTATNQLLFKEWSGKVRLVMWDETKTMLSDRPLLGAGLGNFPTAIAPYHKATWMEIFQYPHNILLNLWSEVGVIGILAFVTILWFWWKNGKKMSLPVMTAILVQGLVDVPYFKNDLAILFWILVILTLSPDKKNET